jgi:hypothetical protein
MGNIEQVLALIFRRKGKGVLSEKEFVFSASIDYRWYTPKEAQRLLELGLERKLLVKTDGFVRPAFDYRKVEVPPDLRPGKGILEEEPVELPLFSIMVSRIASSSGMSKREVVARINKLQERLEVEVEAAGLVLARELHISMDDLLSRAKEEILTR